MHRIKDCSTNMMMQTHKENQRLWHIDYADVESTMDFIFES